ncbi:MAG: hypothetical protein ACJ780_31595 [Solirubrobacteraceae bacterium]|jgi:hypothetical protein
MSEAAAEQRARQLVNARAGGMCEAAIPNVCLGAQHSVHHRRKRRYADTRWDTSNLLALCGDGTRGCHGQIEANPTWASLQGYWLWEYEHPLAMPVLIRWANQRSWWLLDDEGSMSWNGGKFEDVVLAPRS